MKVFLLAITILLLICRIKSTPRTLSKTLYQASLVKSLNKQKESIERIKNENGEEGVELTKAAAIIIVLLLYVLMVVYYSLIGNRFSSNTTMLCLSAIQILTVFITCKMELNGNVFSQNVEDHKFHRFYRLFNLILDYVYYPMAIYLLVA